MRRRLAPLVTISLLSLLPSMATAAPRYLAYVQHFPSPSVETVADAACPTAPDGRFVPGTYRAQVVFFPSDAQRGTVIDGKPLRDRLPRPWGAVGLSWATESIGGGIGWLSSLSYPGIEDKSPAEIRPPLAPPLWTTQMLRGSPPALPPLLEVIFRPLLPSGSSAELLKLFCGEEPRAGDGDAQLVRIHRILTLPMPKAGDIAAVREFLLPGQADRSVNTWQALLDEASSAGPAAFIFADYLGDKASTPQRYLYGRFVETVRKIAAANPTSLPMGGGSAPQPPTAGPAVSPEQTGSPASESWPSGFLLLGIVTLIISCTVAIACLVLRRSRRPVAGNETSASVLFEERLRAMEVELFTISDSLEYRVKGLMEYVQAAHETAAAIVRLQEHMEALETNLMARDRAQQDLWQNASRQQAALEERLAAVERWLAEAQQDKPVAVPDPPPPAPPSPVAGMLPFLATELDLDEQARARLETAPSWEEFARRLVTDVLPLRTATDVLARIDARLGELSGQSVRLLIVGPGARPNPEEVERVTENRIERGKPGNVTLLLRPGLRVDGRILHRAQVEVGV